MEKNNCMESDSYRLFKDDRRILHMIKDYRFLYMYMWRKIKSGSKLSIIYKILMRNMKKHYHIEIPYSVEIGEGLLLEHAYNITLNSKTVLGKNVTLYKGCTVGVANNGVPIIGDNVFIGLNSTVVGGVKIGNDVLIAPNSFVNFDVPDHSVVIGNPGTIHRKNGATEGYIMNPI